MLDVFDCSTLVIIPCCAAKSGGGRLDGAVPDPLKDLVSASAYGQALDTRAEVLGAVRRAQKFTSDRYAKNMALTDGPDFGVSTGAALTMPALDRYQGSLYRANGLKEEIRKAVSSDDGMRILILSALYGPLHPLSPIQDYNLMMSDTPSKSWGTAFPQFLSDYVENNGIRRVALYVGSSTAYFKIARRAAVPLLASGRIEAAVQYHVVEGGTRETPTQHGQLLAAHLSGADCSSLLNKATTRELSL
jgi:hypothetical protein